jgi:hypothetical protein
MSEHESAGDKPRDIGLRAVREARVERAVLKHGRITGRAWLVALSVLLTFVGSAWLFRGRSLATDKETLFAKQRATSATVGSEWFALRDRLEHLTMEAAGPYRGDLVEPEARTWDFRSVPGIYLRLRVADATSPASIRKLADESRRDSFVGCLMRENNPTAAAIARGDADAGSGWNDQPWNLRLAYFATRILSDEWVNEAKASEDEIHLRVFVQQFEKAQSEEIPLAVNILKKAQFFLLVLDEDVDEAKELAPDGGLSAGKIREQVLQQVSHPARVHLFDLRRGKEVVRLRKEASADFRVVTERPIADPLLSGALKRQVNNCALAEDVWAAIRPAAGTDTAEKETHR